MVEKLQISAGKVLFFANSSWYLWNFRTRLAESLLKNGYEIVFCAPADSYSDRLYRYGRFVPLSMDRKGRNPFREFLVLFRVVRLFWREHPDVILTWTPKPNIYGSYVGKLSRIPVIPNVSGLGYAFIKGGWIATIVGVLYRVAFSSCFTVFFQNDFDRRQFVENGRVCEQRTRLLPGSGVDLQRFHPSALPQSDTFVFLFVGRLLVDKGIRELVGAIRILLREGWSVELRIAGFMDPGNPSALGKSVIRRWEAEGYISFLGSTDQTEHLIAGADCVVLPSYREGMPRIVLEASACARPVIVTDVPGCRDAILDGETGFLCKPRDIISLVEAMRRMIELSNPVREAMGQAGRSFMEQKFSEEIVIDAYTGALEIALGKRSESNG